MATSLHPRGSVPAVGTGNRSLAPIQGDVLQRIVSDVNSRLTKDYRNLLVKEVGNILRNSLREQFAEGGGDGAGGGKWRSLKPATIRLKEANGAYAALTAKGRGRRKRLKQGGVYGASAILIETGALRDSYARQTSRDHIERFNSKTGLYEFGSRHKNAVVHQEGLSLKGKMVIPARPVYIRDQDVTLIEQAAGDALALALQSL